MERDGLLFAEVPNGDHRFKDHDQPHLSFFEIDTLAGVVESAGLRVLRIDTCGALASEVGRTRSGKPKKSGERRALWRRAKSALKKRIRSWNPEKLRKKQDPNLESYGGDRRGSRRAVLRSP